MAVGVRPGPLQVRQDLGMLGSICRSKGFCV